MSKPEYDIIIVGGGLVGLAFACAMKESGLRLLVLESGKLPTYDSEKFDIRVNSINLASQTFLDSIGAWEGVKAKRVAPFREIKVWDSSGSRIEFLAEDIGEDELGYIVENNVLTTSLLDEVENASNIELKAGEKLVALDFDSDIARVSTDKDQFSCRLVVGADGANSKVRDLSEIQITDQKSYRQRGIVAQVQATEPTSGVSYQKFLPTGPLAFLPLSDGSYSIVWSCIDERAQELESMEDDAFVRELAEAFDYRLGEFSLLSQRVSFDLRKLRTESYFKDRAVLIGDSAHVIHPLAGMGANLGLMDAAALYEVLIPLAQSSNDFYDHQALRKYERWRKSVNTPASSVMDGFDWGFRNTSEPLQTVLGLGLSLTNRVGLAKQAITRLACGLIGDLPEISRRT